MRAKVKNPTQKAFSQTFGSGPSVHVLPGKTAEYDLTGDQIGILEAKGLGVDCDERDAPPPEGSKADRALHPERYESRPIESKPAKKPK